MSIPSPEDSYDWTFSYKLSKPVYCRQSKDDSTILFEKDSNNNLTGFKIKVNNKTDSEATEINKMKTKKLEQVLTILSGMELIAIPAGREGIPRKPGLRRVHNTLVVKYDIEGSIDKVDITDPNIVSLIKDKENPVLGYLSNAVAHKSHGRYSESIKEAFRVIDDRRYPKIIADYDKYECIRNILSHNEGQHLRKETNDNFIKFFDPIRDAFDFLCCDETNKRFIFDLDSPKTKQTLEKVAGDLISEVKKILIMRAKA